MALSKFPGSYPLQLHVILDKALKEESASVPCTTKAEADAIRFQLYGLKEAFQLNPREGEERKAIELLSCEVIVRPTEEDTYPWLLTIRQRHLSPIASAVERALTPEDYDRWAGGDK